MALYSLPGTQTQEAGPNQNPSTPGSQVIDQKSVHWGLFSIKRVNSLRTRIAAGIPAKSYLRRAYFSTICVRPNV